MSSDYEQVMRLVGLEKALCTRWSIVEARLRADRDAAHADLKPYAVELGAQLRKVSDLQARITTLEAALREIRAQYTTAEARVSRLAQELYDAGNREERLTAEGARLRERLEKLIDSADVLAEVANLSIIDDEIKLARAALRAAREGA